MFVIYPNKSKAIDSSSSIFGEFTNYISIDHLAFSIMSENDNFDILEWRKAHKKNLSCILCHDM